MLKTLIFDLGRVIVNFDFSRAYQAMGHVCRLTPDQMRARLGTTDLVERYESGRVSSPLFFEELCRLMEIEGLSLEEFDEIWFSIFDRTTLCPDSFFESLARNHRLLLLSNTNELHFEKIRRHYPLLRHFHSFVLSYEVGAMKPGCEMYAEALRRAGCQAQECFYTDDIAAYVEAGRTAGFDAVQFQSCEQITRELAARGVRL